MKFGRLDDLSGIDFTLPDDQLVDERILGKGTKLANLLIGLPTWNRQLLKGFYPRGTKDELGYYSSQFNSIEFNASFYQFWDTQQITSWVERTPADFRFFPKVHRLISHERWLKNFQDPVDQFTDSMRVFGDKLGSCFLQLHEEFGPENLDHLRSFVAYWPSDIPLAIEFRHGAWYADDKIAVETADLLQSKDISNIIIDTPGRRDLLHMQLTSRRLFVRFLGCSEGVDLERLKAWSERIAVWKKAGRLSEVAFFLHQEPEARTISLARYLAGELSQSLGKESLRIMQPVGQQKLF